MSPKLKRIEFLLLLLALILTPILIAGFQIRPWATALIAGAPLVTFELAVAARASLGMRAIRRATAEREPECHD